VIAWVKLAGNSRIKNLKHDEGSYFMPDTRTVIFNYEKHRIIILMGRFPFKKKTLPLKAGFSYIIVFRARSKR